MNDAEFKRILIWSGWLRLSHWSIALGTLAAGLTGWQLADRTAALQTVVDAHYYAGAVLVVGLILRLVLLFTGRQHERFAALWPASSEWRTVGAMLRFYLSLGRIPVPRWYGHNPLWKPVYLLVYAALLVQIVSGGLMQERDILWGFYLPSLHAEAAQLLLWFSLVHVAAVALHDAKGKTADVSAIINGYRLFFIDRSQLPGNGEQPVQFVRRDK